MKFTRLNAHMKTAYTYAELSHAKRLKVGAVLIKDDRIVSIGYNGTPTGFDNVCEHDVLVGGDVIETKTKEEVCHGEMNVIAFAAKNGVSTKGCSMVITDSPCFDCAKLIVQCGIIEVIYDRPYHDPAARDFLWDANVPCVQTQEYKEVIGERS